MLTSAAVSRIVDGMIQSAAEQARAIVDEELGRARRAINVRIARVLGAPEGGEPSSPRGRHTVALVMVEVRRVLSERGALGLRDLKEALAPTHGSVAEVTLRRALNALRQSGAVTMTGERRTCVYALDGEGARA